MRKVCWVVALAPFVTGAGAEACQTPVDMPALVADFETGCGHGNADRVSAAIVLAQSSDASESAGNAVTGAAPEMTAQNQPGVSEAEATETATEETAPADSAPEGQAEKPASEQEATSSEEDPVSDEAAEVMAAAGVIAAALAAVATGFAVIRAGRPSPAGGGR